MAEASRVSNGSSGSAPRQRSRGRWFPGLIGLVLTLAAIPVYLFTMDDPWLRSTGLIVWVLMGSGVLLALYGAKRNGGRAAAVLAGVNVILLALGVYGFYGFARLPSPAPLVDAGRAPAFSVPASDGRMFTLSEQLTQGAVLLAFYRGEW